MYKTIAIIAVIAFATFATASPVPEPGVFDGLGKLAGGLWNNTKKVAGNVWNNTKDFAGDFAGVVWENTKDIVGDKAKDILGNVAGSEAIGNLLDKMNDNPIVDKAADIIVDAWKKTSNSSDPGVVGDVVKAAQNVLGRL